MTESIPLGVADGEGTFARPPDFTNNGRFKTKKRQCDIARSPPGWYKGGCRNTYLMPTLPESSMIDPESMDVLSRDLKACMQADRTVLDALRSEIRPMREGTRKIQPRATTAISLVATDGGNNKIQFDPFLIQLVRVVDSSRNELCLEVVTPTTDIRALDERQFAGEKGTALGRLMRYLKVNHLWELSPMIPRPQAPVSQEPISPGWVVVYRDLVEWAVLFELVRERDYGTDTLIIRDGFLRTKVFSGKDNLFKKFRDGMQEGIDRQWKKRRRIYLAGIAKHSKVLQRYRLAMGIERIMQTTYPCYAEVSRELEKKTYVYDEYARGDEEAARGGEENKFVGGKMFFVKFGGRPHDPIWAVDLWQSQASEAPLILGHMLADAIEGFPVPFYPMCLQKAHENAALVDFDMDILQSGVFAALREALGDESESLDVFRLTGGDPSSLRYD